MSTQTQARATVRAEARECSCGHVGINDSHATDAACNHCEWSGPSPKEDHCPECERDGTMCLACPECGGLYKLIAECDISVDRAALTQAADAGAAEPVATVEALQSRIAELEAELDDMEAERDEALRGPWPEWAKRMKTTIRKYSGYDGFDDASDGIDLPAELDDLIENAVEPSARELRRLHAELERVTNNRDMWKDQCAAQAQQIAQDRADAARELVQVARDIEALKRECGMDPESPVAIQNGRYMSLSYKVRALAEMKEKTP